MSGNERHIVGGPWSGAVRDTKATIKVSIQADVQRISLVVKPDLQPTEGDRPWLPPTNVWSDAERDYENNIYTFDLADLQPNTEYHYALVTDGVIEQKTRGRFKTYPPQGERAGFKFALASCSRWTDYDVFEAIKRESDLLFFFHLGDIHYGNLRSARLKKRLERYDKALNDDMGELFKTLPIAYTWDDHDFINDNTGGEGNEASARIALEAYDIYIPHYDFGDRDHGIFQSFAIGKVLFLLTDLRFNQSPNDSNGPKKVLGDDQERWLSRKLDEAKEQQMDLIVMTSSYPYIVNQPEGKGNWGDYPEARTRLANLIKSKSVRNLCMISGDAHMLAIDDGSHSGYSTVSVAGQTGRGGFPVFHAASLASSNSTKGGPYSMGSEQNGGSAGDGIAGSNQYGIFEITYRDETGAELQIPKVIWKGRRVNGASTRDIISHRFPANPTYQGF